MCGSSPCQNGGTCIGRSDGYGCLCAPGFTDHNCKSHIEIQALGSDSNEGELYIGECFIIVLIRTH